MNRRTFLHNTGLATSSLWLPAFINATTFTGLESSLSGKVLVIVQLSGGNDGLNTMIPYRDGNYYDSRPSLAIDRMDVLEVHDFMGFHPALAAIRPLYDQGMMSVINSVGYPNPDRSHFRSMDIWHTASGSEQTLSSGWIGRYLDSQCAGCESPHLAIELDDSLSLAMKGQQHNGFALSKPKQLKRLLDNKLLQALATEPHADSSDVAYLYKTLANTQSSSQYLYEKSKTHRSNVTYPDSDFGRDLKQIAELMTAGSDTRIYYVSISGFDTHVNQRAAQQKLLTTYAEGVAAFMQDLKQHQLQDNTLMMTFSEFGRRVKQNGSGGTDHGTANNVWLIGGGLRKAGFYNAAPDLENLDEGDLKYKIDFRRVYTTLLERWLASPSTGVMDAGFKLMDFI